MKKVLANLGFLFQIAGYFTIPSILVSLILKSYDEAISLFLVSLTYFFIGFPLNALAERKKLNVKETCILLILFVTISPLINGIPYLYLGVFDGNIAKQLINSYFETVSSSTTTGYSLINKNLPLPIRVFRITSQFVNGLGLIFILFSFLYTEKSLFHFSKAMGWENKNMKKRFLAIFLIYSLIIAIFSLIYYFNGLSLLDSINLSVTTLSTTGIFNFSLISNQIKYILMVEMLLSAISFSFYLNLIRGKLRDAFNEEFFAFLLTILIFSLLFYYFSKKNFSTSLYCTIQYLSSNAYQTCYSNDNETVKMLLILMMLIGGMSFSLAGGIKINRLLIIAKIIKKVPEIFVNGEIRKIKINGKELNYKELLLSIVTVFLIFLTPFIFSFILVNFGYSYNDALFEASSAITTVGVSENEELINNSIEVQVILSILMILGRIEIIPLFIALSKVS